MRQAAPLAPSGRGGGTTRVLAALGPAAGSLRPPAGRSAAGTALWSGLALIVAVAAGPDVARAQSDRHAGRMETFTLLWSPGRAVRTVLFDATHAQTAGNADWTITGGYSDFADTLRRNGYRVRSLDRGPLSAQALEGVGVLVLAEPNTRLQVQEVEAVQALVGGGGGVLAIANHGGADRNMDGWDACRVLNDLGRAWGLHFRGDTLWETPVGGAVEPGPLTRGVTRIGAWGATSIEITGPSSQALIRFGPRAGGRPYVASATVRRGRVVAIGDSSPFDDGTGQPGDRLHDGWNDPDYCSPQLAQNAVDWLARRADDRGSVSSR